MLLTYVFILRLFTPLSAKYHEDTKRCSQALTRTFRSSEGECLGT